MSGHFPESVITDMTIIVNEIVSAQMEWTYFLVPGAAVTVIFVTVGGEDLTVTCFKNKGKF